METGLVKYDAARKALEEAHSFDEIKDIRDQAEAMSAYARQAKDIQFACWAAEIKLRAERAAGQKIQDEQASGRLLKPSQKKSNGVPSHDVRAPKSLRDYDIEYMESQRWQQEAAVPEEAFEAYVEKCIAKNEIPTSAALRKLAVNGGYTRAHSTGENEWYTPSEYVEAARKVMGSIDLDPATSEIAQKHIQAKNWFDEDQDGIVRQWHGNVWLNPPYAQPAIARFVTKMVDEFTVGNVGQAIMLTHNYTDTAWFHEAVTAANTICFTRGRVKFFKTTGEVASPSQGQAFFYFGHQSEVFRAVFAPFGFVASV